jgi:hypothetical protein
VLDTLIYGSSAGDRRRINRFLFRGGVRRFRHAAFRHVIADQNEATARREEHVPIWTATGDDCPGDPGDRDVLQRKLVATEPLRVDFAAEISPGTLRGAEDDCDGKRFARAALKRLANALLKSVAS